MKKYKTHVPIWRVVRDLLGDEPVASAEILAQLEVIGIRYKSKLTKGGRASALTYRLKGRPGIRVHRRGCFRHHYRLKFSRDI